MSKKQLYLLVYSCYQSAVIMVTQKMYFSTFETAANYYGDKTPNICRFKIFALAAKSAFLNDSVFCKNLEKRQYKRFPFSLNYSWEKFDI